MNFEKTKVIRVDSLEKLEKFFEDLLEQSIKENELKPVKDEPKEEKVKTDDFPDAKEMRKQTDQINLAATGQLDEIKERIIEAKLVGNYSIRYSKPIKIQVKDYLLKRGYEIEGCGTFVISW